MGESYLSAEILSVYSTVPADWAAGNLCVYMCIPMCVAGVLFEVDSCLYLCIVCVGRCYSICGVLICFRVHICTFVQV